MPFLSQFHTDCFLLEGMAGITKAMAFVRSTKHGQSYGRLFLIAFPQFDQVLQQERGAESLSEQPICPPLSYITEHAFCYTNPANPSLPEDASKRLRYGRILNLARNMAAQF